MEKPNINTPVITHLDHMHFLLDQYLKSSIELAMQHRKAMWPSLKEVYERDLKSGRKHAFFRDFCTARVGMPHRTGLTTWCQRNLPEDALYVSRTHWNPKSFKCRVTSMNLTGVNADIVPDLIVIDDASWHPSEVIENIYTKLAVRPETQLFLLLG